MILKLYGYFFEEKCILNMKYYKNIIIVLHLIKVYKRINEYGII